VGIRPFLEKFPRIGERVFIAENAWVIGDVTLHEGVSVWYGAVLRGDVMPIVVGKNTNLQDFVVLHGTTGKYGVTIGEEVTVGHRAVLHGCTIGDRVLIGIGAILLDGVVVEEGAIVGAGSVVPPGTVVRSKTLYLGIPAKPARKVTDDEYRGILLSQERYQELSRDYLTHKNSEKV